MGLKKEKQTCHVCNKDNLQEIISFGDMPVANAFLKKEDLQKPEFKYEMKVGFCEDCKMVQLVNIVPYDKYIIPDTDGIRNYAFFSSTSKSMTEHFAGMAKDIEDRFLDSNSQVMEIGSNDGIMLQAFKKNKVLGIEPSHNVAKIAADKGIDTMTEFFSEKLSEKISKERGKFKTIATTNVFLNIIDVHDFLRGTYNLLDKKGVFITEDPYIQNILSQKAYDQIYDEHIWYFSLHSLENLLNMNGMEIFDAEKQDVHGGSMRVYSCKKGDYKLTDRVKKYFEEEKENKIDTEIPYKRFADEVKVSKEKLSELLAHLKNERKRIVGYGASSKGTIVCNYCDIGTETLEYIADAKHKVGKFSPGKHIPIVSQEEVFRKDNPDYALLFIPNHLKEVVGKEKKFLEQGGRFITHWPEPRII
ncbi:MAG: class I SAM-dependent methyltransferase [Candidatus Pacearchaeota archaeon]|nr:class I SAM-dependent methyltransferase [Candidatus Pacearchaeota archaeon]